MFFYFLKAEYHLELINNCMRLLVGGENDCSSSKMSKKGFPYAATPPTFDSLVQHVRKSYFVYFLNLLPFSYNASAYKDHNQNWCVIGHVKVQNCLFTYFFDHFRSNSSLLVTMATSNKLR